MPKQTRNDKMVAILTIKLQLSLHQVFVVSWVFSRLWLFKWSCEFWNVPSASCV